MVHAHIELQAPGRVLDDVVPTAAPTTESAAAELVGALCHARALWGPLSGRALVYHSRHGVAYGPSYRFLVGPAADGTLEVRAEARRGA